MINSWRRLATVSAFLLSLQAGLAVTAAAGTPHAASGPTNPTGHANPLQATACRWAVAASELITVKNGLALRKVLPNDHRLQHTSPKLSNPVLEAYRRKLRRNFSRRALDPIANMQAALTDFGQALNPRLKAEASIIKDVLETQAGRIRPVNCLESLITTTLMQGRRDDNGPLDFIAFIMESDSGRRLLVHATQLPLAAPGTVDDGIPHIKAHMEAVTDEVTVHWNLKWILHAHPHRFDHNGRIEVNHIAPRVSDLAFLGRYRSLLAAGAMFTTTDFLHAFDVNAEQWLQRHSPAEPARDPSTPTIRH